AERPISPHHAILALNAAERDPAILGTLVVEKKHTGGLAIRMRMFLALKDDARKTRLIGNNHPNRAVRLDDIDPLHRDLFEVGFLRASAPTQNRDREHKRKNAGIDSEKTLRHY